MNEFQMTLEDCGLNDLGYIERWFTWKCGRFLATNIRERLDREVVSLNWVNLYPSYQLEHLSHSFSDHCPILLDTMGRQRTLETGTDERLFELVEKRITADMNEKLLQNFTKEEITQAVKLKEPLKAPGIDGFPVIFFQSVWDLIDKGILWRIGNGASINIWNDPWLPRAGNNRISAQQINPNWTTVNQLIESETNTWNKDLIYNIVDEDHAARIFSILLSEANSEDMLVWKHEGTGEYSVKSRSLKVEVNCPICKAAPEDSDHLLWSCGILQQIWASLKIKIAPDDGFSSCKSRFVNTFSIADNHNRQLIAISIWALWYRRNKLIYEGVKFSLQELLGFIRGYGHEIYLSQENLRVFYRSPETERWNPPEIGFIKINFDATFKVDSRTSTTVVLARDSKGEVVGAETYLFEDVVDAFVAEARACERAILFHILWLWKEEEDKSLDFGMMEFRNQSGYWWKGTGRPGSRVIKFLARFLWL
ncbi:hypothetical protein PVK06_036253 [Gossypium arboreum]|uniref:Reverse transcriptase zinc-binding domain-containing protein n=1 Tax=Gossypium arboreum TaxID=29729 RepID=A0ABR0NJK6_GOSAR|nr:hypothetical protein PVK06_036253 [Gossypium arboreum]